MAESIEGRRPLPHYVYRLYDAAGDLLYVGCTYDPRTRRLNHRLTSHWFSQLASFRLTVYPNRAHALEVERAVIATEKPRHNIRHAHRRPA